MNEEIIQIPDIGGGEAEVIEINVSVGDTIKQDEDLIILESDKANMEVPSTKSGKITEILLKIGDKVSQGTNLLKLATINTDETITPTKNTPNLNHSESTNTISTTIKVPDIGVSNVPVIEINVSVGDIIEKEDTLIVLESDKASMDIPSTESGVIKKILVNEGDQLNQGDDIVILEHSPTKTLETPKLPTAEKIITTQQTQHPSIQENLNNKTTHAGPSARKTARELGVELQSIIGSGRRQRILKEDVQNFANNKNLKNQTVITEPEPLYSQWGDIESRPLNRLRKIASQNFQSAWSTIPHVTQFDEADITQLEAFRKEMKPTAEKKGTKLTPLPFFLKACANLLKEMPQFCSSLSSDGESVIYKKYINIGIAVDTPDGLLVPVIKNVDQKGLWQLSSECIELATKARNKKLKPDEMQGGCFTISSLGSIGGTAFTPIINKPEVAILGISKASMKPIWNGKDFDAKLICPLCLSYDHRVINGADAARFTSQISQLLADVRMLLF